MEVHEQNVHLVPTNGHPKQHVIHVLKARCVKKRRRQKRQPSKYWKTGGLIKNPRNQSPGGPKSSGGDPWGNLRHAELELGHQNLWRNLWIWIWKILNLKMRPKIINSRNSIRILERSYVAVRKVFTRCGRAWQNWGGIRLQWRHAMLALTGLLHATCWRPGLLPPDRNATDQSRGWRRSVIETLYIKTLNPKMR